ncbi:MAG TPA: hypothetical protein PLQ56_19350 [Aggregatilineales bacterium]|nr:hypothetical protein [Aggregatilineales bacterium]
MNPTNRRMLIALLLLIFVPLSYYGTHPVDLDVLRAFSQLLLPDLPLALGNLANALLDLLPLALLAGVGGGLGRVIISWILNRGQSEHIDWTRAERLALEGMVGLGLLSSLALLVGLSGQFNRVALWGGVALVAVLTWRGLLGWLRDAAALLRTIRYTEKSTLLVAIFVVLMLALALIHALIPPVAFDAVNYHLVGPARYLRAGAIQAHADNHFLGFPQGVEILYGVAISLFGRDTAAAPIHWWFGVLALLAIGGLINRYLHTSTAWWTVSPSAAWWTVALTMTAWSLWLLFGWPYVDLAIVAYSAGVLIVAARASSQERSAIDYRLLAILGLLLGLAVGVKYTTAGLALALGVWLLFNVGRSETTWTQRLRQWLYAGLLIGGVAALTFLPWALKGALLYQNPVYPFLFGGLNWDSLRATTFSTAGQGLLSTGNLGQLIALPLAATIQGIEKTEGFGFTIGPWVLVLPLLLLVSWNWLDSRAKALARLGLTFALPALLFWMGMAATSGIGVQTRLALFGLPAAVVLSGVALYGLGRIPSKRLPIQGIAHGIIGLTLVFTLLGALQETGRDAVLPWLTGQLDRDAMLDRGLGVYAAMQRELATLPAGSQVRFLYESKSYHCPATITCVPDILFDYWVRPLRQGLTTEAVIESWRAAGDDYVLVFQVGYDFWKTDPRFLTENARFPEVVQELGTPLWSDPVGAYQLYRLPA